MKFNNLSIFIILIITLTMGVGISSAELIPHYATLTGTYVVEPSQPPAELSTLMFSGYSENTGDQVIGTAEMNYYESGDEFYYELNSTDLKTTDVLYTLVYFNPASTLPYVVVNNTIVGDSNGNVSIFESVDLNDNLEDVYFKLYWNVGPSSSYFIGDNSVNYTDTNIT